MADAGIRLQVEGEKEFKAALSEIDTAVKNNQKSLKLLTEEYKLNDAGMKDSTSGFGSMADAAAILADKGKVLADSIVMQTEKVGLLDQRVQEAAEAYGEHDRRTEALRAQLLDASTALTKMTVEQEKNRQAILDAQNSTKEYDDTVAALNAQIEANEAELKALGGGMDDLKKKTGDLQGQNQNLQKQNETLSDSISKQKEKIDALAKAQETSAARYGQGSKEAESYRKQLADATKELDNMERELKENQTAIENNNAAIEKGGDAPNGMIDGLKQIEELTGIKIPSGIETMISGFDGGTLAVGGIVTALAGVATKMNEIWQDSLDWASDVTTKATELDLSTEEYQQLEYVADKAQVSVGVFENALSKLSSKAGDSVVKQAELREEIEKQKKVFADAAQDYNEWRELYMISDSFKPQYDDAVKAFEDAEKKLDDLNQQLEDSTSYWDELGISITDGNGNVKRSIDLLWEVIDAFSEYDDNLTKSSKMNDLFGKSYKTLNPLVESGSEVLREWMDEAKVTDSGMTATMNQAKATKDALGNEFQTVIRNASAEFMTSSNVIEGAIEGINTAMGGTLDILEKLTKNSIIGGLVSGFTKFAKGEDKLSQWWWNLTGQYASGTDYHPGGLALVGEQGPEIVDLPRGSAVYPNGVLPASLGNSTTVNESNVYNVTIDAASVQEFNDIVRIAQGARVGMRRG